VRGCESPASRPDPIARFQSLRFLVPSSRFRATYWANMLTTICKILFTQLVTPVPSSLCPFDPASLMTLDLGGFYQ
jgi:hypothetical protein